MAGVSKHYIFRDGDRTTYDYQIPERLLNVLPNYAAAFEGSGVRGRDRKRHELQMIWNTYPNWRKRLVEMWKLRPPGAANNVILTEYRVRSGSSAKSCSFRAAIGRLRPFKKKLNKKAAIPAAQPRFVLNLPQRFLLGENEPPPAPPQPPPVWGAEMPDPPQEGLNPQFLEFRAMQTATLLRGGGRPRGR